MLSPVPPGSHPCLILFGLYIKRAIWFTVVGIKSISELAIWQAPSQASNISESDFVHLGHMRVAPRAGCSVSKCIRAATPRPATAREAAPMDVIDFNTVDPFPESLRCSQYVVMFVDSTSRLQHPYETRDKSASAILDVVKRLVADIGVPRAVRADNGAEYTNLTFVDICNDLGICREFITPYTPQQDDPVESGLWRGIEAWHTA